MHHTSLIAHNRKGGAIEQPDDQPPAKRHKSSNSEWRSINQEDSDDEIPIKRSLNRHKTDAGPDGKTIKPQSGSPHSHDTIKAAERHSKNRQQTVIEILDSPPSSPLFCPTSEPPELDEARPVEVEPRMDDLSTITGAADYAQIQERLRALEAENYQCQTEKRQDRERVLKLEEQISVLREEQDRKLEEKIRELRRQMNYAINQIMMQQPKKAEVER